MKPRHLHTVHTEGLNQLNHDQLFYTSFLKYSFSLPGQTFRKENKVRLRVLKNTLPKLAPNVPSLITSLAQPTFFYYHNSQQQP